MVVLEEDERHVRVHLDELADDMTRAGVSPTRAGISAALSSWVAHRPVTDAAAASSGNRGPNTNWFHSKLRRAV